MANSTRGANLLISQHATAERISDASTDQLIVALPEVFRPSVRDEAYLKKEQFRTHHALTSEFWFYYLAGKYVSARNTNNALKVKGFATGVAHIKERELVVH